MVETQPKDSLERALSRHGVLSSTELVSILGSRVAIKRKAEAGALFPLGSGIYASPSLDPLTAALIAATRYYPGCVISNLTALVVHKLSDEAIGKIDVDIDKSRDLKNRLLKVHRISRRKIIGITILKYEGHSIRVYDRERALGEAYLIDPGGPVFFKALKRYLSQGKPDAGRIKRYDRILKTNVLLHLQQELADA